MRRWIDKTIYNNIEDLLKTHSISSDILYSNFRSEEYNERIIKRFEKYADNNRVVIIPHRLEGNKSNSDYTSIYRTAKNKGFDSIEAFASAYGYTFLSNESIRNEYNETIYQDGLVNRTIDTDKIYINTMDPFYISIRRRSMSEGYATIDEYLLDKFKLLRIFKEEIEKSIVIYKWTNDLDKSLFDYDELYKYLRNFTDDNGVIDESRIGKWYRRVYTFAYHYDKTVPELLKSLGLKYTYKSINQEKLNETEELIEDLKQLNDELEKSINITEKYKRNSELVKILKRLYNYRCQCCKDDNQFPPIIMHNNKPYVEVHHIKPIASIDNENWSQGGNDESNIIVDHYKNCLVVCPYHHKQIHFENNGYFNFDRNKLRIYNQENKFIQIHQDLHLVDYD